MSNKIISILIKFEKKLDKLESLFFFFFSYPNLLSHLPIIFTLHKYSFYIVQIHDSSYKYGSVNFNSVISSTTHGYHASGSKQS